MINLDEIVVSVGHHDFVCSHWFGISFLNFSDGDDPSCFFGDEADHCCTPRFVMLTAN